MEKAKESPSFEREYNLDINIYEGKIFPIYWI
jgi:hypothetical protein